MTELIFNGIFTDLTPSQCVALLSCFMCDEKSNTNVQMTEELAGPLRRMQVQILRQGGHSFEKSGKSGNFANSGKVRECGEFSGNLNPISIKISYSISRDFLLS